MKCSEAGLKQHSLLRNALTLNKLKLSIKTHADFPMQYLSVLFVFNTNEALRLFTNVMIHLLFSIF